MYKFIKTHNEKNQNDHVDIMVQSKYNDLTLEDLFSMFKGFLQACGFPVNYNEELDFVKTYAGTEEIQLDLTPDQFNAIAALAHERDITFNEMVNTILSEQISVIESKEEFNSFVEQLKEEPAEVDTNVVEEFNKIVEQLKEQDISNEEMVDGEQLDLSDQKAKLIDTPEAVDRDVYEKEFGTPPDSVEKEARFTGVDQPDSVEQESRYEKMKDELKENQKKDD